MIRYGFCVINGTCYTNGTTNLNNDVHVSLYCALILQVPSL